MKKYVYIFFLTIVSIAFLSCNDDKIDENRSVIETDTQTKTSFDTWLYQNYITGYNMEYKYRMDDKELDYKYNLVPANLRESMQMARIIKHVWVDAYVEVAGQDFMREHAPAILQLIGSAAWNDDGTMTLGTAEGGLKITLYMINWLNPEDITSMNQYFFKTMHHEFTHILQQDVNYPQEYNLISAEYYSPSAWFNRRDVSEYAPLGFITSYAGSSPVEDITELTCSYLTLTAEEWNKVMDAAGTTGRAMLDRKVQIMKGYMQKEWNIDMDELRMAVSRRMSEIQDIDLIMPEWEPLLTEDAYAQNINPPISINELKSQLKPQMPKMADNFVKHKNRCLVHGANLWGLLNSDVLNDTNHDKIK